MTTEAKLAEMRERAENAFDGDYSLNVIANSDVPKLLDALEAVLAMEEKEALPMRSIAGDSYMEGYNQFRSEMRATIEGVVGNE